jgi:uncharacterized oxidoreductase
VESDVLLPTEEMRQWVCNLWRAAGSAEEEAQLTADHLIGANLAGHDSHGVSMVAPYVRSLQAGELQLNQRLSIITDAETLLVVDGNRGMGQSIAFQTMQLAVERARRNGVVIVGLRNTHHIGRVGHWAEQAIAAGLASPVGRAAWRQPEPLWNQPVHRRFTAPQCVAHPARFCY